MYYNPICNLCEQTFNFNPKFTSAERSTSRSPPTISSSISPTSSTTTSTTATPTSPKILLN